MSPWNSLPINQSFHQNKWDGKTHWPCSMWIFDISSRRKNVVPDALRRKHQLKVVYVGETKLQKEVRLANHHDELPRKWSSTFKRESSHTSTCEMDYCGISKIGSIFQKKGLGMCSRRSAMMVHLVVQSIPQHSSRSPIIGLIWKTMQRNT